MANTSVFECSICVRPYDELCVPLSLPCGHVYCKACMVKFCIESTYSGCPTCKVPFDIPISQLPVCQPLLQPRGRAKLLECVRHPKRRVKYCCKPHSAYLCSECILNHLGSGHEVIACRPSATAIRQQIKQLAEQADHITKTEVQTSGRLGQIEGRVKAHYERELNKVNSCFDNTIRCLNSQRKTHLDTLKKHEEASKVALTVNRHSINSLMSKCHTIVSEIERLNQNLNTVNPDMFFKALEAKRSELSHLRKTLNCKAAHGELHTFQGEFLGRMCRGDRSRGNRRRL
mmetsp:Transcript_2070/g.4765  ORF Transcript_2070/g.4765 Transcript_2070/m.4765 type:complete len:288 (-) Transcript_2070:3989-4852(-)